MPGLCQHLLIAFVQCVEEVDEVNDFVQRKLGGIGRHAVADALGLEKLRVVTTGGDEYQAEREQWDDGNNVVALEPGVVVGYSKNEYTNRKLRNATPT